MAYQFADGFDNYGNNFSMVAGYPWDLVHGSTPTAITTDYRFAPPAGCPGGCLTLTDIEYLRKNLSGNQSTLIACFGVKLLALPVGAAQDILSFMDTGQYQTNLYVTQTGQLQFQVNGSPIATSAAGVIVANAWYGIAVQVTFATGSSGSVEAYVNGAALPAVSATGVVTTTTGNPYANQVQTGGAVGDGITLHYDDFFCFDTTGSTQNAIPATDTRIITKVPTSAGFYTNWTPNGLAANWQNAAPTPPNTSDYNSNNTGGTKDSYAVPSTGLVLNPYAVIIRASMEKDDGATHTPSLLVRSNGIDSVSAALPALGGSYLFYDYCPVNDTSTNSPWTGSSADLAQPGVVEG